MTQDNEDKPPSCSFCNKMQTDHVRLLEASRVTICNHCVAFAYQIFEAEGQLPSSASDPGFEDPGLEATSTRKKIAPPR